MKELSQVEGIIEAVGGKENIQSVTHCVTRLRFVLKDESIANKEKLEQILLVKGVVKANGQYQIVIGPEVEKVYKETIELLGFSGKDEETDEDLPPEYERKEKNKLAQGIKILGDIFIPILPAIVTAGLLMGINNLLTNPDIFYKGKSIIDVFPNISDLASMINLIANTSFSFLPVLVSWSTVKYFKGNPLLGIVLGLVFVHPDLMNTWGYGEALTENSLPYWNIFGLHVTKMGLQAQVLPALVSGYLLAKISNFFERKTPANIKLLVVAPVSILVTSFITFIVISPITMMIGQVISNSILNVFNFAPIVGGALYGITLPLTVVTGMHYAFLPIQVQLMAQGGDYMWPIGVMSSIAQGGAALSLYFISKDKNIKGMSIASCISAFTGITEPAMFGVNLRFKYPFVFAIIGSGVTGAVLASFKVIATSVGISGLPGFLSIPVEFWLVFLISMVGAFLLSFGGALLYGRYFQKKTEN